MAAAEPGEVTGDEIRRVVTDVLQKDPYASEKLVLMAWRSRRGVSIDEPEQSRVSEEYQRQVVAGAKPALTEDEQARRQRPLWLVAALTLVTFQLYWVFGSGLVGPK